MRDELRNLIPPIGSVWGSEPFAPERVFSQTVMHATENSVTYRSQSGDEVTVSRLQFFDMFPWRFKEGEKQ